MLRSVYNEERNLLRLRAWEQRNQETSQAKELNPENVPLFGEPYKVKTRIVGMKCSNGDTVLVHLCVNSSVASNRTSTVVVRDKHMLILDFKNVGKFQYHNSIAFQIQCVSNFNKDILQMIFKQGEKICLQTKT